MWPIFDRFHSYSQPSSWSFPCTSLSVGTRENYKQVSWLQYWVVRYVLKYVIRELYFGRNNSGVTEKWNVSKRLRAKERNIFSNKNFRRKLYFDVLATLLLERGFFRRCREKLSHAHLIIVGRKIVVSGLVDKLSLRAFESSQYRNTVVVESILIKYTYMGLLCISKNEMIQFFHFHFLKESFLMTRTESAWDFLKQSTRDKKCPYP